MHDRASILPFRLQLNQIFLTTLARTYEISCLIGS